MVFFKKYRARFEELRREDLTDEQRRMEDQALANDRVTLATVKLKELEDEFKVMSDIHWISIVPPGFLRVGKGSFEEVAQVHVWWNEYKVRLDHARVEFNAALGAAAALKTPDTSVHHLDGSESEIRYKRQPMIKD